jgi:ribonuclease P protein component
MMLAKVNRVKSAGDFRTTVRRGRRFTTLHSVIYIAENAVEMEPRFGFIISKAVGGAVTRNTIRRRLRSIGRDLAVSQAGVLGLSHRDVVVRVLPGAAETSWPVLYDEVFEAVSQSARQS